MGRRRTGGAAGVEGELNNRRKLRREQQTGQQRGETEGFHRNSWEGREKEGLNARRGKEKQERSQRADGHGGKRYH